MQKEVKHPCEIIYGIGGKNLQYGSEKGICRIIGKEMQGVNFDKWVKNTFNDHSYLKPGNIISNQALFCFDEGSKILQEKTGRDKPQRFRTYTHVVHKGKWYCLTKADKEKIFNLITDGAELVCLTDTGQRHLLFKHKIGMWQLDDLFVIPDTHLLKYLHKNMCELLKLGFSQSEVITGDYKQYRIFKAGLEKWRNLEKNIEKYRSSKIFQFTSWILFIK